MSATPSTTSAPAGDLQLALADKRAEQKATIMPGFTHLQSAQPVTFGHHLLAYVEMLGRDARPLRGCRKRLNENRRSVRPRSPARPIRSIAI
jgi:argininosuccinate lyase